MPKPEKLEVKCGMCGQKVQGEVSGEKTAKILGHIAYKDGQPVKCIGTGTSVMR